MVRNGRMDRPTFTLAELARRWHVSTDTVRRMIQRGELTAFRVGRSMRVPAEAVDAIESHTTRSHAA